MRRRERERERERALAHIHTPLTHTCTHTHLFHVISPVLQRVSEPGGDAHVRVDAMSDFRLEQLHQSTQVSVRSRRVGKTDRVKVCARAIVCTVAQVATARGFLYL